ncbi:VOC family protein [Aurantimicrobium minutum]|nr:VOC family protein [Aurantimicrobium minutum]MDH6207100.1 catechol 2,3-dioxygenase-like lactoylglutathione lyase family enzyme [Aurantimicrobium minutum]
MSTGIPGLRGAEHIGFTVPDIEQAHSFFVDVIGCDFVYKLGPWKKDDEWFQEHLNINPRSVLKELRFYRCNFGPNFEVFEFEAPFQLTTPPLNSDVGGHHIAFYVDDMDAAVNYLKEKGVRILGEPISSSGASEGQRWVYFLSPWGMQFELVSFPHGKAYEAHSPVKLWHPANPAA